MKVLIVVQTLSRGGAERAAGNVSQILARSHQVSVITFHNGITYEYSGDLFALDLPYNAKVGLGEKAYRFYKKLTHFRRVFHRVQPDVVLSFTEGPSLIALLGKWMGLKAKYITNTQAHILPCYHGLYRLIYFALIRFLYRRADCVTALSSGVRDELVEHFNIPRDLTQVIYNPIDCQMVERQSYDPLEGSLFARGVPVFLSVGRLVAQKNPLLLVRAFHRVRKKVNAELVLIGSGYLEAELRVLVEQLGMTECIHFLGWQENPFRFMRRAHALVLSSVFEGFGNVLVEAMASDCPVIATDCPFGPAEVLGGGEYGLLVKVNDEEQLASAMLRVLEDDALRHSLIVRGRARARDFDLQVISKRYTELFAKLGLSGGRSV